jgi:hypothetical protein
MDGAEAGERGYIMADESPFGATAQPHGSAPVAHAQPGHTVA